MKKILSVIILSALLVTGSTKPALALKIDAGQIAAKIAEIVQDITDAVQSGIQEVNKVKQMAAQGFNNDIFREKAAEFAKYGIDYAKYTGHKIIAKRFKKVEGDTKAQNKKVLEKDKENYQESTEALYTKQIEAIDEEILNTRSAEAEASNKMSEARSKEASAKADYEAETNPEAKNQKLMIYMKYSAEAEKWTNDKFELEKKYYTLLEQKADLEEELGKITSDDQYKSLEERSNAMEAEENELISVDPGESEWDNVNEEDYDINKHYDDFTKQYFFNPDELGNEEEAASNPDDITANEHGNKGAVKHQSRIDRIMRQRRFLVVNSAAHLMQVAASMRRSLPAEYKKNKDMFTTIGEDKGELAAKEVYSSTRVEGARALLMYAKLLCAKLQYETARDLLKSDVERRTPNNTNFDLSHYILDTTDVEAVIKKFSYSEDTDQKMKYYEKKPNDEFGNY